MTDIPRRWYPLPGPVPAVRRLTPNAAKAAQRRGPIDPLAGPKLALAGRVVMMDDAGTVKPDAVLFIEKGTIVAVQDRSNSRQ